MPLQFPSIELMMVEQLFPEPSFVVPHVIYSGDRLERHGHCGRAGGERRRYKHILSQTCLAVRTRSPGHQCAPCAGPRAVCILYACSLLCCSVGIADRNWRDRGVYTGICGNCLAARPSCRWKRHRQHQSCSVVSCLESRAFATQMQSRRRAPFTTLHRETTSFPAFPEPLDALAVSWAIQQL